MMIADAPFGLHKHGEGGSWDSTEEAWTGKEFGALLGLAQVGFEILLQSLQFLQPLLFLPLPILRLSLQAVQEKQTGENQEISLVVHLLCGGDKDQLIDLLSSMRSIQRKPNFSWDWELFTWAKETSTWVQGSRLRQDAEHYVIIWPEKRPAIRADPEDQPRYFAVFMFNCLTSSCTATIFSPNYLPLCDCEPTVKRYSTVSYLGYSKDTCKFKHEGEVLNKTQKPVSLFLKSILAWAKPETVVLDLTCGSGTTAVSEERKHL